jgi:putative nucleotidyltransferase with HDIG domain
VKEEVSQKTTKSGRGATAQRATRKLNLASRVRGRFRRAADRVLDADLFWTAALVLVTLSIVGTQRCGHGYEQYVVGQIAPKDIRAIHDVDVFDEALTEERRQQARNEIVDIYIHDSERRLLLSQQLASVFADARDSLEQAADDENQDPETAVELRLSERVPERVRAVLTRRNADVALERALTSAVSRVMGNMIIGNKALLEREPAIVLVQLPGQRERRLEEYAAIIDVQQARRDLEGLLHEQLPLKGDEREAVIAFAASFIDANVYLDSEATYRRREAAATAVAPVLVRVARGDLVIRKGERITQDAVLKLEAAQTQGRREFGTVEVLGLFLLLCMLAFFVYRYSSFHQRMFRKFEHLHALLVLLMLSMLLLTQAIMWLAFKVTEGLPAPFNSLHSYHYLVPLAAGSILVALLANGRLATVYAAFVAVLFGGIRGFDFELTLWAFIVQLSGVYAISTYRNRAALLRPGLVVGCVGAVSVLALEILRDGVEPLSRALYGCALAFIGGALGTGLLVSFSLPILEWLFKVLTDVRLLELSNVDHPLASQLAIKAPGSYNHSLVVGTLAEEAAKAIGANSLFCRVAAIYHDIGKINHPEYFVENQRGINPHDRLSPSMSALIIASHVKDGIKMAREAGLPEQVVDIIPQHHGTKKMSFFYEKAKQASDPTMGPVKEEDFRYPGPKPQTREAAIFMIADAVEAAARTVGEPSPNRLREMIRKVTNSIVLDGQLDHCELTFADLERIQEAFLRLLVSMYHRRVDYPGFDFGPKGVEPKPSVEPQDRKVARGV